LLLDLGHAQCHWESTGNLRDATAREKTAVGAPQVLFVRARARPTSGARPQTNKQARRMLLTAARSVDRRR
jgi:hypothetical protein